MAGRSNTLEWAFRNVAASGAVRLSPSTLMFSISAERAGWRVVVG